MSDAFDKLVGRMQEYSVQFMELLEQCGKIIEVATNEGELDLEKSNILIDRVFELLQNTFGPEAQKLKPEQAKKLLKDLTGNLKNEEIHNLLTQCSSLATEGLLPPLGGLAHNIEELFQQDPIVMYLRRQKRIGARGASGTN